MRPTPTCESDSQARRTFGLYGRRSCGDHCQLTHVQKKAHSGGAGASFFLGGGTPAAAGRKLRGEIGWSIGDLFHVAEFLGVEVSTLLPARGRKIPANPEADGELVAGTGFEPVTSGL